MHEGSRAPGSGAGTFWAMGSPLSDEWCLGGGSSSIDDADCWRQGSGLERQRHMAVPRRVSRCQGSSVQSWRSENRGCIKILTPWLHGRITLVPAFLASHAHSSSTTTTTNIFTFISATSPTQVSPSNIAFHTDSVDRHRAPTLHNRPYLETCAKSDVFVDNTNLPTFALQNLDNIEPVIAHD